MQTIDRNKIAKELEAFCDKYDTYGAAAKALGITLAQLSTARNDENSVIPAKALAKLGYGYTLVYVRKADMPAKVKKPKRPAKKSAPKKPAAKKPAKTKAKSAPKKPAAKKPAKTKAKKPAAKKADKPAPAPRPAVKPQRAPKPEATPPVKKDPPASAPPVQVVNVTNDGNGVFN